MRRCAASVATAALAAALFAACASTPKAGEAAKAGAAPAPLGLSKASAVEVCMGRGERDYLARLRCADGSKPTVGRRSNVGVRQPAEAPPGGFDADAFRKSMDPNRHLEPGERDPHIVDVYTVECGAQRLSVYLDMYHCAAAVPREAPPGLLLAPAEE